MDGNGRWAKKRFMPRLMGHRSGLDALRRTVTACVNVGVQVLTVFAFSSENWNRPSDEVNGLMDLLGMALSREVPQLHAQGVQLHFPGDKNRFSSRVLDMLATAEQTTVCNTKLVLNVCFNYGGRWDICQAAAKIQSLGLACTEALLGEHLALSHVPDPDLFIRTGGEMRVSNFLLWQMAYTEFYFSDVLWPDFGDKELQAAIQAYQQRQRRFGKTSEQLQHTPHQGRGH